MQDVNIVELIEKNPITRLSNVYNNKLLNKIKENFTGFEQQLFVSSFYCYLNYDKNIDFVVDLDNVWKWLGFQQKQNAKVVLERNFKIDIDYKSAHAVAGALLEQPKMNGGQNKQTIMLTIKCFKSLCLKAQTKKASEIHEYYMKMEEVLHDIVEEETDELRLQLEQKDNFILKITETSEQEKIQLKKEKEQAIITQFPINTECIYIGTIDNTNAANEKLIKFGHSNDLKTRLNDHRKTYDNFQLITAFRVQNKVEIEGLIKTAVRIRRQIRNIEIDGKIKRELIAYDLTNFTIDKLINYIKEIIVSKTYSIDNFNKLMKEKEDLEIKISELEKENELLKEKLVNRTLNKSVSAITNADNQFVYQVDYLPENEQHEQKEQYEQNEQYEQKEQITKFNEFIDTMCIVRHDVKETSVNMEGQLRIWLRTKPKKENFHNFKQYLDDRFNQTRLSDINKGSDVRGYIGVKLKPIEYKKQFVGNDIETFIFQSCEFSPGNKILNAVLFDDYKRWNDKLNKNVTDEMIKGVKEYLNSCEYVVKSIVWTEFGSNEGYYGLTLKNKEYVKKVVDVSGKKVDKIELSTGHVLETWATIAKAAEAENIPKTKMSRSIKNKTIFTDYFYSFQNNK